MVLDSLFNKEVRLLKKIEKMYAKSEKLKTKNPAEAHELLVEAFGELNQNKEIIKDKKENFSALLASLGHTLNEMDDPANGEQCLKMAINLNPKNINAYIYYAKSSAKRKNYELAQSLVDKAISINRKSQSAWETKAEIYERMGDVSEALKIYRNLINLYPEELKYYERYLKYNPNDHEILLKEGILVYKKGDYQRAAEILENVVKLNPSCKDAYLYLGAAYEKLEKYEESIKSFRRVISLDPENEHAWINLAVIYKKRGEYDDALSAIKESIKINPNNPKTWSLKASIEYAQENYSLALNSINQALNIEKSEKILLLKREILKKLNAYEEMIETCKALIEVGKRDVDIYYDLADAYFNMKDYESALKVTETVLSTTPHHLPTLTLQKEILKAMGRWERVISTCEKILEIDPKNSKAMVDTAISYEKMNKLESALHFIKMATQIEPKNVELWKKQRDLAKLLNKPNEIITACMGILNIQDDFDTYLDLAKAYYNLNRFGEAKKAMEKALKISENAEAWNLNGMINYKLNDLENAKKSFERATILKPDVKKYWSNFGWILEKLEMYEEAIEAFNKALEIDNLDMRIWYEKGVCLRKLGKDEEALKCFDEALKIDERFTKALMQRGEILLELGHLEEALKTFNQVLSIEPSNSEAFYRKAYIEFKSKKLEACEKDIENAIKYQRDERYLELKKDCCKAQKKWNCVVDVSRKIIDMNGRNMNAYRDLATGYMEQGKVDSAVAAYQRALEIFPNNLPFMYELKKIFMDNKRYADIIELGKKILAEEPEDYNTLVDMGRAAMELERYDEAEDYLTRALAIKITKEVYDALGELYMKKKDYENAKKYFADSLKIEEDPEIYYKLALSNYLTNNEDFALSSIRKAIALQKQAKYYLLAAKISSEKGDIKNALKYAKSALNLEDSPKVRVFIGKMLVNSGEYDEAIAMLKEPAKNGDSKALELLGYSLEKIERFNDAEEIYKKLLKQDSSNQAALIGLGRVQMALEKYEDAKKSYEKAHSLDPENREICENLSFIYEKLNDLDNALKYLDLAIEIEPDNKHLWTQKGSILMNMKRYEEAKRAYEKALSIDSEYRPAVEGLKDVDRILENKKIESYARQILEHEFKTGKKITKKDAFKKLNISLSILPKVFKYIEEDVSLDLSSMSSDDRKNYEKATLVIAKKLHKIENLELPELIGNTNLDVLKAKKIIKYVELCRNYEPEDEPTEEDERLIKRLLDLDLKDKSVLNVMLNLEIGICTAKRILWFVREFFEEEAKEEDESENAEEVEEPQMPPEEEDNIQSQDEYEDEEDLRL